MARLMNTMRTAMRDGCPEGLDDDAEHFLLPAERLRFYPGQLLTAEDMQAEQAFFLHKARNRNLALYGWGVGCGFDITFANQDPWRIAVGKGFLITPQGDEIHNATQVDLDLRRWASGQVTPSTWRWQSPTMAGEDAPIGHLVIRQVLCGSRPQRIHPVGCGCASCGCEYSRWREAFALRIQASAPLSTSLGLAHRQALSIDHPTPFGVEAHVPCWPQCDDPWLQLAAIHLQQDGGAPRIVLERLALRISG